MNKIRILIAEDHSLVRQGLIKLLETDDEIFIIGEAEDGQNLYDKYIELKPDIVLSDISMPKLNGIEAAGKIINYNTDAKIIFLSIFCSDDYIVKSIKIGASGLVSKEAAKGELVYAIHTVAEGGKYYAGKSVEEVNAIMNRNSELANQWGKKDHLLDDSEKGILTLIAQGFTSEEIANKLSLNKRAVDVHRSEIMEKLGLKSLPKLIKYAVEFLHGNKSN